MVGWLVGTTQNTKLDWSQRFVRKTGFSRSLRRSIERGRDLDAPYVARHSVVLRGKYFLICGTVFLNSLGANINPQHEKYPTTSLEYHILAIV
jgi:hypothetical protein